MDPVVLSVTQLCRAAVDSGWRAAWIRGEEPTVLVAPPAGTVAVHGTQFHAVARKLVQQLVQDLPGFAGEDDLYQRLLILGGEELLDSLLQGGKVDSAAQFAQALHNFARRVAALWKRSEPSSWQDVFVAPEYAVRDAKFELAGGIAFVSGAIDCVRHHPRGGLEVVDYKLSHGSHLEKELVQVALYRELLRRGNGTAPSGALEYFLPELQVQDLTAADLEATYEHWVVPALTEMIRARQGKPASPGSGSSLKAVKQASANRDVGQEGHRSNGLAALSSPGVLRLGTTRAVNPVPVELEAEQLKRHVAVLGGSGSGKTTLALAILEQLLLRRVPVLVVDRKGDLCRYGEPLLTASPGDERFAQFRSSIDVAVFTPGEARGRPLAISILPRGLENLDPADRTDAYKDSAAALGAMLNLRSSAADQAKQAILFQALRLLGESGASVNVSLENLIELIGGEDPALLESIGRLDPKQCKKLASDLTTMSIMRGELLSKHGDELTAELFFGLGHHRVPDKTRLSIVSTKFFSDDAEALFWVSQLLAELNRFASRSPSATLQAAVMFDEADIYLPANTKPPTKSPLESLLKRARSAGLSVMLATQSPGDLDYKCRENVRNWFVGLVKEPRALEKLKPMLSDAKLDAAAVLPKQKVGQFFLLSEALAVPFSADRNLLPTQQLSESEIIAISKSTTR